MEGWSYPEDVLMDGGEKLTAEQTLELWQIVPPSRHPKREEIRVTSVVYPDGTDDTSVVSKSGNVTSTGLESSVSGIVVEGLRLLMEAIK
jgi:hypothetical protein